MSPFYYLDNFRCALSWLQERYGDLLSKEEHDFIHTMSCTPRDAAALLVRMIMRRGAFFRMSTLRYAEIGCVESAVDALERGGWIDTRPALSLEQLCGLLRKRELQVAFSLRRQPRIAQKDQSRQLALDLGIDEPRPLEDWWRCAPDRVLKVLVKETCERLRLMFFGDFEQDWSEFVLAEMGIRRYESVNLHSSARAFHCRQQIEHFCSLHCASELLQAEAPMSLVRQALPTAAPDCDWIASRHWKLLLRMGLRMEQSGDLPGALEAYRSSPLPEARVRTMRVLERMGRHGEAVLLVDRSQSDDASELERQHAKRIGARLLRRLGMPSQAAVKADAWTTFHLQLEDPGASGSVERLVCEHLGATSAPVFYVENTLINSLFGLLFWNAIFAPVPGAFFHPFQCAPIDLLETDFQARRARELAAAFALLERGEHQAAIWTNFDRKSGILNPFVAWGHLTRELLALALTCMPAAHLRACFERLLSDLRTNRTGLPDLIQFWPEERRYRMIEVKGPGDRLQDNQIRWLGFCAANTLPVEVCSVRWVRRA